MGNVSFLPCSTPVAISSAPATTHLSMAFQLFSICSLILDYYPLFNISKLTHQATLRSHDSHNQLEKSVSYFTR